MPTPRSDSPPGVDDTLPAAQASRSLPSLEYQGDPVSTRVKSLANDDPGGVAPLED
jgi:hypothetical protein